MALQSDVNNAGGADGGAEILYAWKTLLVLCGWTVEASGGGTGSGLYSAVGDVLGSVALTNVSRAWCRLKSPPAMVPRREICWQRGSTGERYVWIKISAEDGFTGGAADEDDMPTATDEQNLIGSTTAGTVLWGGAASYHFHMCAEDANPFNWWIAALVNGTGASSACVLFEPMQAGTYPAGDDDPAVYYASASGLAMLALSNIGSGGSGPWGWWSKDLGGEAWARMPAHGYKDAANNALLPEGVGTNPYTGQDSGYRILYGRSAALVTQVGTKGYGASIRWNGIPRAQADTQSTAGVIDRIVIDDCTLPWPNVVPVI